MNSIGRSMRWAVFVVALATMAVRAEPDQSKAQWTGFTAKQLAEHLEIEGGNITFRFERPLFINVTAVEKKGEKKPLTTVLDRWSRKASIKHDLFLKVQDTSKLGDYVAKRISIRFADADGNSAGYTINSRFESETGNHGAGGAWRHVKMRVQEGTDTTVYEVFDSRQPEGKFFRLTVRFSASKPSADRRD